MIVCPDGCDALIDSGTTLITFESNYFSMIKNELNMVHINCDKIDELPNIEFQFKEGSFTLTPHQYLIEDGYCQAGIMPLDLDSDNSNDQPFVILGIQFMKHFYTVFDRDGD